MLHVFSEIFSGHAFGRNNHPLLLVGVAPANGMNHCAGDCSTDLVLAGGLPIAMAIAPACSPPVAVDGSQGFAPGSGFGVIPELEIDLTANHVVKAVMIGGCMLRVRMLSSFRNWSVINHWGGNPAPGKIHPVVRV